MRRTVVGTASTWRTGLRQAGKTKWLELHRVPDDEEEARRVVAEAFGRRVAVERQERQMTQGELARLLDVTQQYVSAVEHGHENLTLLAMARFAEVFGREVGEMLRSGKK